MKHLLCITCLLIGTAHAAPADAQMAPVVEAYLAIQAQLAQDGTADVAKHARVIKQATAKLDWAGAQGPHAAQLAKLPGKLTTAAAQLEGAADLKAAREGFKALSRPMVLWASVTQAKGLSVVYCSMAKGSWLQADTTVRNPYYGASMLACGEIVDGVGKGTASGHMKR